mmetsp:Transcript_54079/g.127001  ORF Transcript_54079/g.127001 Transcript_54079/m.127001 type:complete len:205 (-) Transcript_54079:52-666(-)
MQAQGHAEDSSRSEGAPERPGDEGHGKTDIHDSVFVNICNLEGITCNKGDARHHCLEAVRHLAKGLGYVCRKLGGMAIVLKADDVRGLGGKLGQEKDQGASPRAHVNDGHFRALEVIVEHRDDRLLHAEAGGQAPILLHDFSGRETLSNPLGGCFSFGNLVCDIRLVVLSDVHEVAERVAGGAPFVLFRAQGPTLQGQRTQQQQ